MSPTVQPKSTAAKQTSMAPDLAAAIARRGIEAVNWGMPAVNFDLMYQAHVGLGGKANEITYWSNLFDWKNQTLTPNPNTIYLMPFFSTKDVGPMVLEIPPAEGGSITGTIMDCWQAALEDVGPAGVDKGKGGKYLILPPGYTASIAQGYIVLQSMNFQGYALLRSILKSGGEQGIADAVAYATRGIKLYPLSAADEPPETMFHDALGKVFDSTIAYDATYFRSLNRMVQIEPWLERDKAMVDMLRTIGIEKGKPFAPDDATQTILAQAARDARAWLDLKYNTAFVPFFEGRQWAFPASPDLMKTAATFYEDTDQYSVDGRGLADTYAFTTVKHLGAGQYYLMALRDKDDQPLDGANTYRLQVPANVPVQQYWSVVLYDRVTHALIRDVEKAGISSQSPSLKANADGSVTLQFGPHARAGNAGNWLPTKAGGRFEVMVRFYGPDKALFDKSWVLPDIEKV